MKDVRYWKMIQAQEEAEEEARWEAKCELEDRMNAKTPSKKVWSEEEIMNLIQTNDKVLYGALKKLYACQTVDEQREEATKERNGKGFNGVDASFLSSVAEFLLKRGYLTDKQKVCVRKRLVKYNKQLTLLANA